MNAEQSARNAPVVDGKQFRHVVGHLPSGVTVVTTELDDRPLGMTVSSVTSLSADPPLMLACLNNSVPTTQAVAEAGSFAVNVLGERFGDLAYRFATPSPDKFAGLRMTRGLTGAPLLDDALAHVEVTEQLTGGTHTAFVGRVVTATANDGPPLTYFRGGFGRFEFARNDEVYRRVRQHVLEREYCAGDVVEPESMAKSMSVDGDSIFYALTRLTGDGLVRRDPELGYVVVPLDVRTSDATFEARFTIELGVLDEVIDSVGDDRVAAVRSRFEAMSESLSGDRFVDFDAYLTANYTFHEPIVGLADNPILTATFGALAIKQVMTRSFGSTPVTSQQFIETQRGLMNAIEARDLSEARRAARAYTDLAKARVREIVADNGGAL